MSSLAAQSHRQRGKSEEKSKSRELSLKNFQQRYEERLAQAQRTCISMDPFEWLLPECVDHILKYLAPIELLKAMEVTTGWKTFIESSTPIYNRALDKIIVNFDSEDLEGVDQMTLDGILANARSYKHLEADFEIESCNFRFPFANYASSLETLKINCHCQSIVPSGPYKAPEKANFVKLKKLIINCDLTEDNCQVKTHHKPLFNFIKASLFPEVTHLKIFLFRKGSITLKQLLQKFPKLKVLLLTPDFEGLWSDERQPPFSAFEGQPILRDLCLDSFYKDIVLGFKNTLFEVCIDIIITTDEAAIILGNCQRLCQLTINYIEDGFGRAEEFNFPTNENLKGLLIREIYGSDEILFELILAVPSLRILTLDFEVDQPIIFFLTANTKNLKKLICEEVTEDALAYFAELKNDNDAAHMNTNFVISPDFDDDRSNEEYFYDMKFK